MEESVFSACSVRKWTCLIDFLENIILQIKTQYTKSKTLHVHAVNDCPPPSVSQGSQHAVLPEDPAAALGPVRTDLQPVPAPLPQPLRPPVRRPAGGAGLLPRGGLGVPAAVRGVPHLLLLLLILFILLCRVRPRQEDLESLKLPLHEPDQAQGADAPQQQQRGPQEQTDPVPGRPHQHHERPVRRGQGQEPARQGGRERASPGADRTEKVTVKDTSWIQTWPVCASFLCCNRLLLIHFLKSLYWSDSVFSHIPG